MVDKVENGEPVIDSNSLESEAETQAGVSEDVAGTNLLTNGSFEDPVLPTEGFGGFETVTGWTAIEDGQIEVWRNRLGIEATDGVNFLELDYVDGQDGFSQSVNTVAGQDYTLTFDTRLSEAQDIASQGIEVLWNGDVIATVYPGSTEWEEMSFTVTGTGGSDTLTIREPGDGTQNDGLGALLDNFALVADGEPVINIINGTIASDFIEGTVGADQIRALSGDDTVDAGGGDDLVFGQDGNDRLFGDFGNDQLVGGTGFDELRGGPGNDQMWGEDGRDFLDGGEGDDILVGGAGDDNLIAGAGNDELFGDDGDDFLWGGLGADLVVGGSGANLFRFSNLEEVNGDVIFDFTSDDILAFTGPLELDADPLSYIGTEAFSGTAYQIRTELDGADTRLEVDIDGDGTADGSLLITNYTDGFLVTEFDNNLNLFAASGFNQITGSDSTETLVGTSANDYVLGLDGNDELSGLDGDDILFGGAGNDHLISGEGDDFVFGQDGDDRFSSSRGDDTFDGGDGVDTAEYQGLSGFSLDIDIARQSAVGDDGVGSTFRDRLLSVENVITGDGNDLVVGDGNANRILTNDGDDFIVSNEGDDFVAAGDGNDTLRLGSGDDIGQGGDGNDDIDGGSGSDRLFSGLGSDQVRGGNGADAFIYTNSPEEFFGDTIADFSIEDVIDLNFDTGTPLAFIGSAEFGGVAGQVRASIVDGDTIIEIDVDGDGVSDGSGLLENYVGPIFSDTTANGLQLNAVPDPGDIVGTNFDDNLSGTDQEDRILAFEGRDQINGSLGDDILDGGEGFDTANYFGLFGYQFEVDVSLGTVTGQSDTGEVFTDQLVSIEAIETSNGNDIFRGDANVNVFDGGAGNDLLEGGAGGDFLTGGFGADRLLGGEGHDSLFADAQDVLVDGGPGDDLIYFQTGNYNLDVDLQNDRVSGQNGSGETFSYQILGIEGVFALGAGADVIRGTSGPNVFATFDGDDLIDASGGIDQIWGGLGADVLTGGAGDDQFWYFQAAEILGDVITDFSEGDLLEFFSGVATGDANPTFIGESGFTGIVGQIRSEQIGADTVLEIDADGDGTSDGSMTLLDYTAGFDVVSSEDGIELYATSIEPVFNEVVGTDENDFLYGTAEADQIDGLAGSDWVLGSLGNDIIDGGAGDYDSVNYFGLTGYSYQIDLEEGTAVAQNSNGNTFTDQLRNIEIVRGAELNDVIIGSDDFNQLVGNAGDDTIFGGGGWDVLNGGDGSDRLYGGDGNDQLTGGLGNNLIDGGDGTDLVNYVFHVDHQLSVEVNLVAGTAFGTDEDGQTVSDTLISIENVSGASGDDRIIGDEGKNRLEGRLGDDVLEGGGDDDELFGGEGVDQLFGGAGDDFLSGGIGADTLEGGTGADTFRYWTNPEEMYGDVVEDFSSDDILSFSSLFVSDSVSVTFIGTAEFSGLAGQIRADIVGTGTVLELDADGDGVSDGSMTLANFTGELQAEDHGALRISAVAIEPPPPGTNLLTNGSFEDPVLPTEGFGGFDAVAGWTAIEDGQIEVWRNRLGIEATDGVNFLELDYVDGQDGFSQSVNTVSGQDYTLTFDTRLSEAQDIASQGIEVLWNGEVIATVTPGSTEWEEMSFTVTGTGGSDTLTIREPGDGTQNDGLGALLDNFALVASPETTAPASTVKLALDAELTEDIVDAGATSSDFVADVFTASTARTGVSPTETDAFVAAQWMHQLQSDTAMTQHQDALHIGDLGNPSDILSSVDDDIIDIGWDMA